MANVFKVRTTELTGTGRTSLRFEETTWAAIDALAVNRGIRWQDWARDVIAQKPGAPNKSAVIRAALVDELLAEQFIALGETGAVATNVSHEIVGNGYWRLNDEQLQTELEGATIITRDSSFGAFILIYGYRDKSYGGEPQPFVIIQNELRGQLHLMIAPAVD